MKKSLYIIFTIIIVNVNTGWAFVASPLLFAYPCNGSTDIVTYFEPGLLERQIEYTVYISKKFPSNSVIKMQFDESASVTRALLKIVFETVAHTQLQHIKTVEEINMSTDDGSSDEERKEEEANNSFARINVNTSVEDSFEINILNDSDYISFTVNGLVEETVPYFTRLNINSKEYCEKPNVGYLDSYVLGYVDHGESFVDAPVTTCGRRKVDHVELIVSGAPTKPGDFPWHAALYKLDRSTIKYICGGTLISKNVVLTAGHCSSSRGAAFLPEVLSVVLGKYNLIGGDVANQEREVHRIILHENFNYSFLDNDIALLKLKTDVFFTDYVQPACLWYDGASEKLPTNEIFGTVVGWGFDNTDSLSLQLNQATIPMVSEITCIKSKPLFYSTILTNQKFCAGYRNGTSACNGDSGGAFQVFIPDKAKDMTKTNGAWFVRGIVSLTVARTDVPICDPEHYVVFTDVAKYIHWIESNM